LASELTQQIINTTGWTVKWFF